MNRMADELEPVYERPGVPIWVKSMVTFKTKVRAEVARNKLLTKSGALAQVEKAAAKGEEALRKAVQTPMDTSSAENIAKAAEYIQAYEKALADIIPITSSREKAFQMAGKFFPAGGDAKSDEKSPFYDAHIALAGLKNTVADVSAKPDNLFWRLLSGPLNFLLAFMTHEAACELQIQWRARSWRKSRTYRKSRSGISCLIKTRDWSGSSSRARRLDFLGRDAKGYFARSNLNQRFPLTQAFLTFLDQGASQTQMILPEYKVSFNVRPTTVNRGALLEPFSTILTLDCQSGAQVLENNNYPAALDFKWVPDKCTDVTLKINFNDFTLVVIYQGVNGFPEFLEDFKGGTRTFTQNDFPDFKDELEKIKVNHIRVSYVIKGGG
jgi:type VI secretion system protein ImpL